jgi:transposase
VCQARDPGPGHLYFQRKLAEKKTENEARRALKRRLANIIYRHPWAVTTTSPSG